jgi:ASC-1-like (ASCH) protein
MVKTLNHTLTLRIKKKYFDLILSGEKTIEYRDFKPYYQRIFQKKYDYLRLHYQSSRSLIIKIEGVRKIKTPKFILATGIEFSNHCYAIKLGDLIHYRPK